MRIILLFVFFVISTVYPQEVIDFQEKGRDDGNRTTRDQDYEEALIDAKRKVLEKAGIEIKSFTKLENFQLIKDQIESKSEGMILPGMSISDFGYDENGYYQVFIVGKIKVAGETVLDKKIRYAKSLYDRNKKNEAKIELDRIIRSSDDDDLVAQSMYYKIIWNLSINPNEELEKLKSYYPESKYINIVENLFFEQNKQKARYAVDVIFKMTSNYWEALRSKHNNPFFKNKDKGVRFGDVSFKAFSEISPIQNYGGHNLKYDNLSKIGSKIDYRNSATRQYFTKHRLLKPGNEYKVKIMAIFYGYEFNANSSKHIYKAINVTTDPYNPSIKSYCLYIEFNGNGEVAKYKFFPYKNKSSLDQIKNF